jgi:hypothetical protein
MIGLTPRIVILDNDQTTGDYDVFFKWLYWLETANCRNFLNIAPVLASFISLFEQRGIFRPGLKNFLIHLCHLKQQGYIDYVVIYTNQSEPYENPIIDSSGLKITIPQLLEIIYNSLCGQTIIDLRLTRPETGELTKSFSRVFEALNIPRNLWNASKTLFFDDLIEHCPKTNDIANAHLAHVRVPDYRVLFDNDLLLRMCRLTVQASSKSFKRDLYTKDMINEDLNLALVLSDVIIHVLQADMRAPIIDCFNRHGDPKRYGFGLYMDRIETTFMVTDSQIDHKEETHTITIEA